MPKISIVTVAFNSEATIEDTLRSVQAQKDADYEHIIVDGASRDGTMAIVERHRSRLAAVISEPDKGLYDAMNKGVAAARGTYVGFLNSDDYFAGERSLAHVQQAFERDAGLGCVWGDVLFVDGNYRPRRMTRSSLFRPSLFRYAVVPPHPGFFARADAIRAAGGFEPKYRIAGDFDLMIRLFKDPNFRGSYLDEVVTIMRLGGVSTQDVAATRISTSELLDALARNGIPARPWMVNARYVVKLMELARGRLRALGGKTYPPNAEPTGS